MEIFTRKSDGIPKVQTNHFNLRRMNSEMKIQGSTINITFQPFTVTIHETASMRTSAYGPHSIISNFRNSNWQNKFSTNERRSPEDSVNLGKMLLQSLCKCYDSLIYRKASSTMLLSRKRQPFDIRHKFRSM